MSRRGNRRRLDEAAFTLLEVMVALAILAMGLTALSQIQQGASRQVLRSKMMTTATLLARHKMVDVEDDLFEEGFSDFEETQEGDFEDEGFPHYRWELKVEKIELPENVDGDAIGDAAGEATGQAGGASESGMSKLGGNMLGTQFQMFKGVLEDSIRRVSLRVLWKEGRRERVIPIVAYFTDPRKIDGVAAGLGALTSGGKGAKSGEMSSQQGSTGTTGSSSARGTRVTTPARTTSPVTR